MVEFWIQLESNPWDLTPNNIDRMTGQTIQQETGNAPVQKTLFSPSTQGKRQVIMYTPVDALIFRRYWGPGEKDDNGNVVTAKAWTVPRDNKVNPWDLNEPDPTDNGTMGTIPGPVIECNVGDQVLVHFRNQDLRQKLDPTLTTHSLHTHGFAFQQIFDGGYPLSPADPNQPIPPGEAAAWATLNVTGFKQGDRVPVGGTFDYTWDTSSWPPTSGVWIYHDHSINADQNVLLGAIGMVVIHDLNDKNDVVNQDLPPFTTFNFKFPPVRSITFLGSKVVNGPGGLSFVIKTPMYNQPPNNARYLLLFHEMVGSTNMLINGRAFMGNTPTLVAGRTTKMRFGVAGMNQSSFHTFHLHGHRWVVPGPALTAQASSTSLTNPEIQPTSQFEDTRTFGPANSFSFTIQEGSFMGADQTNPKGEWHLHCHVLMHMMGGMMGSLVVVDKGDIVSLPSGQPMPPMGGMNMAQIMIMDNQFQPNNVIIKAGQTVQWTNMGANNHSVTSNPGSLKCAPPSTENFDSQALLPNGIPPNGTFQYVFNNKGLFAYHCEIHGCPMNGTVTVQ